MIRQYELVERVKAYDPNADEDALNRAYVFSLKAHGAQMRASGDPYFSHPLEVAGILTDIHLDTDSIVTALLHDTVEDTVATLPQIESHFGGNVAKLVDGVTKLSQLELQSPDSKQAENFRKLMLATSEDIRVLLVKLADRLHNMRTLSFIATPEKRTRIARETMEIYAPLAERIGWHQMKDELEDLAFAELNVDARQSLVARLEFLRTEGENVVPRIVMALDKMLADGGLKGDITGREKRPYSIWRKMYRKNVGFEGLADIMAFRVLVDTKEQCYQALGIIHTHCRAIPERFKDYISTPKVNGYQSLHTAVIGPEQRRIEIQIRTREMHEVAELGVAAHWQYKQGIGLREGKQFRWLREMLEIIEHASGPEEFLEHTRLAMYQDQVFCFTPKGDLIAMPRGATPVDFAYAVHSQIGDTCIGCKINGKIMPLRTPLSNGDQVEIATAKGGTPSPNWEGFVVTAKARSRLRRFVRSRQRTEYLRLGQAMLTKAFREAGYEPSEAALSPVLARFEAADIDDLHVAVGKGTCTSSEVLQAVFPHAAPRSGEAAAKSDDGKVVPLRPMRGSADTPIPIRGLIPGMAVHYANCCHPLPGDRIVGIVTQGKGVTIHTIDCETLESFHETPERWLDVAWDMGPEPMQSHVGRVNLVVANERGTLGALTTAIAKHLGNINNLKITNRSEDFFEMAVDIEVDDAKHLAEIIAALRAVPQVTSVDRARG